MHGNLKKKYGFIKEKTKYARFKRINPETRGERRLSEKMISLITKYGKFRLQYRPAGEEYDWLRWDYGIV
jgi:hypothetical protein